MTTMDDTLDGSEAGERSSFTDFLVSTPLASYGKGDRICNKYCLVRKIGEGGMGAVWIALNTTLQTHVAIKLIRKGAEHAVAGERLLREARAAALLCHPAIVRVFDFGVTDNGEPFLVMELLQGENLGDLLHRERTLSACRAVQIMLPVIDALVASHARGIIHRDLKPENIFLARDDAGKLQPKLVDFGIVKVVHSGDSSKLTHVGTVVGSPEYMSPEQARGLDDADGRTDIWSLSIALYELITGRLPFAEPNYNALMRAIIEDPMPSLAQSSNLDEALWSILELGLHKQKEERWPSMREFGQALAGWLWNQGVTEDICASSLAATWLQHSLDDMSESLDTTLPSPRPVLTLQSSPTQVFSSRSTMGSVQQAQSEEEEVGHSQAKALSLFRPLPSRVRQHSLPSLISFGVLPSVAPAANNTDSSSASTPLLRRTAKHIAAMAIAACLVCLVWRLAVSTQRSASAELPAGIAAGIAPQPWQVTPPPPSQEASPRNTPQGSSGEPAYSVAAVASLFPSPSPADATKVSMTAQKHSPSENPGAKSAISEASASSASPNKSAKPISPTPSVLSESHKTEGSTQANIATKSSVPSHSLGQKASTHSFDPMRFGF